MMSTRILLFIAMTLLAIVSRAQVMASVHQAVIYQDVQITFTKTASLIFPERIQAVDRGSADVLVQKARGVDNVLQIKARRRSMTPTNLTVITSDGSIYHLSVEYAESPVTMTRQITDAQHSGNSILFQKPTITEFERDAATILRYSDNFHIKRLQRDGIRFGVEGIYIRDNQMYYNLYIENQSPIDYDVDQLNLYVRDNRKVKRTAFQEIRLVPLFQHGTIKTIKAFAHENIILCVEKFTLADGRHLALELSEKKGGRNLLVKLKNRHILKAESLSFID